MNRLPLKPQPQYPIWCPKCPKCPLPTVCPPPNCPPCIQGVGDIGGRPPRQDQIRLTCEKLRILSADLLSASAGIKVYWMIYDQDIVNYPQLRYSLQLSSSTDFNLDTTWSYPIEAQVSSNGFIVSTKTFNRISPMPSEIEYVRIAMIFSNNQVEYSNYVRLDRLKLETLDYTLVSDSVTAGTISANISINGQLYSMNPQVNIENTDESGRTSSRQLILSDIVNDRDVIRASAMTPMNVVFFNPPKKSRLFIVVGEGTPSERVYYSNYVLPRIF